MSLWYSPLYIRAACRVKYCKEMHLLTLFHAYLTITNSAIAEFSHPEISLKYSLSVRFCGHVSRWQVSDCTCCHPPLCVLSALVTSHQAVSFKLSWHTHSWAEFQIGRGVGGTGTFPSDVTDTLQLFRARTLPQLYVSAQASRGCFSACLMHLNIEPITWYLQGSLHAPPQHYLHLYTLILPV